MDSHGWRIRDNTHHSFRQSISTLALPRPLAPLGDQPSPYLSDDFAQLSFSTIPAAPAFQPDS